MRCPIALLILLSGTVAQLNGAACRHRHGATDAAAHAESEARDESHAHEHAPAAPEPEDAEQQPRGSGDDCRIDLSCGLVAALPPAPSTLVGSAADGGNDAPFRERYTTIEGSDGDARGAWLAGRAGTRGRSGDAGTAGTAMEATIYVVGGADHRQCRRG